MRKILLISTIIILISSGMIVEADDCNPTIELPTTRVRMNAVNGTNSWFDMTLSNISSGYDVSDGHYLGWCARRDIEMSRGVNHTVTLYSSYDPNMPETFQDDDWDKINYILNHKQGYNYHNIQNAIWFYLNHEYPSDPAARTLINETNTSGVDYCPGSGDVIAILVEGIKTIQQAFFELTIPEPEENGPDNGGDNGGGGGGRGTSSNYPPTADAYFGEPYQGFVDSEITFDGSHSYDRDGDIVSWYWDFGDGTNGSGDIVTHIYTQPGIYTVILTVTDDDGATDSYQTIATIAQANMPPTKPTVVGTKTGTIDTDYTYTAVSTDPDNDTIRYIFNWDDNTDNTVTNYTVNGTIVNETHQWTVAGVYIVKIYAEDENNATSDMEEILLLIDVTVEFIKGEIDGYLIDYDQNGIFNVFYNNATGEEIQVQKQDNNTYLIDSDGDGEWDYVYDSVTEELSVYSVIDDTKQKKTPSIGIIGVIFAIAMLAFIRKQKPKTR